MSAPKLKLYHYWRSTSSWRVRWALALKGIDCELQAISLLDGESESDAHLKRHPLGFVPALEFLDQKDASRRYLTESLAIIGWLDETFPTPALMPADTYARAKVRELAELINADTHPLQNLSVQIHHSENAEARKQWAQHWIRNGLSAYEKLCAESTGKFSVGDEITLADLCLLPQLYNAERFEVSLDAFPVIRRIADNAKVTAAYQTSEPEKFKPLT